PVVQLGCDVVAEPFRIQSEVEIEVRADAGPARFRHLLAGEGDEAVHVDPVGHLVWSARELEHGRPEQGMEVDDVLSNEMDLPGVSVGEDLLEGSGFAVRPCSARSDVLLEAREITDRSIEPD